MFEPTDKDLDKALREQNYSRSDSDPQGVYYRVTPSGVEKLFTDGNRTCEPDSNYWKKYQDGDKL